MGPVPWPPGLPACSASSLAREGHDADVSGSVSSIYEYLSRTLSFLREFKYTQPCPGFLRAGDVYIGLGISIALLHKNKTKKPLPS